MTSIPILLPILLTIVLLLTGCAAGDRSLYPPAADVERADIVLLDNHWHTAPIVAFADLPHNLRDQLRAFAACKYLTIGWGDEGFFRAAGVTSGLIPQAMFYSRGSVILVIGFNNEPEETFGPEIDIYRIPASRAGVSRLIDHIDRSLKRDADGELIEAGPGPDGSQFYEANGRYAWNHTCNHWTAAALHTAGLPITPVYAATAGNLAFQLRQLDNVYLNRTRLEHRPIDHAAVLQRTKGGRP